MSNHMPVPEEEINLGSFFNQIVNLFKQLIAFIVSIFRGIYSLFIEILIFFRKHLIPLAIALIAGLVVGILINNYNPKVYQYRTILEPNYEAAYHVSSRVDYYNQLIKNKDFETLNKLFNITEEDSENFINFELESQEDTKTLLEKYDEYINKKDTLTRSQIDFEDYAESDFSAFDAKYYNLFLYVKNSQLTKIFNDELIKDLENNPNLKEQQQLTSDRINLKEEHLKKLLKDIDSVRIKNKEIALVAAQNGKDKTTFDFNKSVDNVDSDVSLFEFYKNTTYSLDDVLKEKEKMRHIYNVITPFEAMGLEKKPFYRNPLIIFPLLFLIITSMFLLRRPFLNYLDQFNN